MKNLLLFKVAAIVFLFVTFHLFVIIGIMGMILAAVITLGGAIIGAVVECAGYCLRIKKVKEFGVTIYDTAWEIFLATVDFFVNTAENLFLPGSTL